MMEIKEQTEHHLVLGLPTDEKLGATFVIAVCMGCSFFIFQLFAPILVSSIISAVVGILTSYLFLIVGIKRIVIDKPTQTITIKERSWLLICRKRDIPFSDVRNVTIGYSKDNDEDDIWSIYLDIGEKLTIDYPSNKEKMLALANTISHFIGVELEDKSAKPESSSAGFSRKVKGVFSRLRLSGR